MMKLSNFFLNNGVQISSRVVQRNPISSSPVVVDHLSINLLRRGLFNSNIIRSFSSNNKQSHASPKEGESVKAVVKPSQFDHWKKELISLSAKEIKNVNENRATQIQNMPEDIEGFVAKNGFKVVELKDGTVELVKTEKAYKVSLKFNMNQFLEEEEEEAETPIPSGSKLDESDEDGSGPERSEGESELEDPPTPPSKTVTFEASITFNNKQGEPKGKVLLAGEVAADCRIYVSEIQAHKDLVASEDKETMFPTARFETLTQDFQDRMYDLLDEVGIDDKMGTFVRYYADSYLDKQTIKVMENFKDILSS